MFALKEGVMKAKAKGHVVLVLGDMNARIGGLSECPSGKDTQLHPAEPMHPLPNSVKGSVWLQDQNRTTNATQGGRS